MIKLTSQQYLNAIQLRYYWCKNETIEKHIEEQLLNETKFLRDVLYRIIKIILFLTTRNIGQKQWGQ